MNESWFRLWVQVEPLTHPTHDDAVPQAQGLANDPKLLCDLIRQLPAKQTTQPINRSTTVDDVTGRVVMFPTGSFRQQNNS